MSDSSSEDRRAREAVRQWIQVHFGMSFDSSQQGLLWQRLDEFCRKHSLGSVSELERRLLTSRQDALSAALAEAVSTNHTYFFREPAVLDDFVKHVVPVIRARPQIRIWSAAASSGEEAYTLSMIMAEQLGLAEACNRVSILGTDISNRVIKTAERAVYGAERMKDTPKHLRNSFARPMGFGQFEIVPELRKICTFRRLNLAKRPWPFVRKFDVVFLRNVLYYFDKPEQTGILKAIHEVTANHGSLLTSLTEQVGLNSHWGRKSGALYFRESGAGGKAA